MKFKTPFKKSSKLCALAVGLPACLFSFTAWSETLCDVNTLVSTQDPIPLIEQANKQCTNDWFYVPRNVFDSLYSEDTLQTVNKHLQQKVSQYTGNATQATEIANLIEYVRAAYYVRFGLKAELGEYSDQLSKAFAKTVNQFLANPYATEIALPEQTNALYGMTYMVVSIKQLPMTMKPMLSLLNTLDRANANSSQYVEGLNNLFRAMHGNVHRAPFQIMLKHHPEYLDQLHQFIINNEWALDTPADILLSNAARELGRLLTSPDEKVKQKVMTILDDLLIRYPFGGKSDSIWIGIVEMLNHYAPEKAKALNLTTAKADLEKIVLPITFNCEGPAIIRAQKMTQKQAQASCDMLNDKETDFHQVVNSGYNPVSNDSNDSVEVVVFDTNSDYITYSNFLFGNTTNNGGQYLEGKPSREDNQARFIAYRNEYAEDFSVLNLEHEYVHYLDGRFNLQGGFNDNLREGHIVWWIEGFAEYMTYKKNYTSANDQAEQQTYRLSEIFASTYSHDLTRIYSWGYLAVRFMFERHPENIQPLLNLARLGRFKEWATTVKSLGKAYDHEFSDWLKEITEENKLAKISAQKALTVELTPNTSVTLNPEQHREKLFYVDIAEKTTTFSVSISGDGDADLHASYERVAHYYDYDISNAKVGSNETITFDTPKPGRYYLSVVGREASNQVKLVTQVTSENLSSNTGNNGNTGNNSQRPEDDLAPVMLEKDTPTEMTVHQNRYMAVYVPEGNQTLRVWLTPKASATAKNKGNVNLYAAQKHWPSQEEYSASSTRSDSHEFIEMKHEQAGYVYLLITADQPENLSEVYVTYF
ncbi:M9 family metallopeptidase [Photobacterium sp.]|uniref:M9 family metallopeptidase n=1 Tax=Photobacterium sp. TaxID=660 RepID=UPI00299F08A4|nr:collagenase [Photobacterium sp.]MDX1301008.1 collagenase [Photobacterium sp.]